MVIYGLSDSAAPGVTRYVGQTSLTPEERFHGHLKQSLKKFKKSYKCDWIRKVYSEGRTVVVSVIAHASTNEEADSLERHYIAVFRSLGFNLTNITDGGSTVRGLKWSQESRDRLSKSMLGVPGHPHTEEFKQRLGDRRRGIVVSAETLAKQRESAAGKHNTKEQKKKISDSWKNRMKERQGQPESLETRARRRAAWVLRRENTDPARFRERAVKGWITRRAKATEVYLG